MRLIYCAFIFTLFSAAATAQPFNDECEGAIQIFDVTNWCSAAGEYTNVDATASTYGQATCFSGVGADVWFSFVAVATDITITIRGNANPAPGGTIARPEAALYGGICGGTINQLECQADVGNNGVIELYQGGLTPGQTYYLRVQGLGTNVGTFQLCFDNYFPPVNPGSDCIAASILCDKTAFAVQSVVGFGMDDSELDGANCFNNGSATNNESNSTWFVWTCDQAGTLEFTLTPLSPPDDLDFVIFELPNGVGDCTGKNLIRCMASGDFNFPSRCMGPTGLADGETDIAEPAGCNDASQNNFIAPLDMVPGTSYALVINNFTSSGNGFRIEFGGTGTFLGPQVDFVIDPEIAQCDVDVIDFDDNSSFNLGNIVGWNWTFGVGANPPTSTMQDPNPVVYESFGPKTIVLTVESDLGCIVTESVEIFIEPCCDPANDLVLLVDSLKEPSCNSLTDGFIDYSGSGGSPDYLFSTDGNFYTPLSQLSELESGNYTIRIQDIKGCIDSIDIFLDEPPPIGVDVGPDITIDLGFSTTLDATVIPPGEEVSISWEPSESVSCPNCFMTQAIAPGTTQYLATVVDSMGCIAMDSLTVFVLINRPIYIPNAFSPNDDGVNDFFSVFGGPAARGIKELKVYNRWGALVYEGYDLPLNDTTVGWNGTFKGKKVNPGVYAFYTVIDFIDNKEKLFKGDVTIVR